MRRWIAGAIIGTLVMWSVSAPLLDSVDLLVEAPALGCYIPAEGSQHAHRTEGWARTHFGKHGIAGVDDVTSVDGPIVAIWGDSYVEGFAVSDEAKLVNQITRISSGRHPAVTGVGIGASNRSVSDYFFLMPRYARLFEPICHFIVLGNIDDVSPDGDKFIAHPEYRFVERPMVVPLPSLQRLVHRLRLEFTWRAMRELLRTPSDVGPRKIRLWVGPVNPPDTGYVKESPGSAEAWKYLLTALKSRTAKPIVFVYAPWTPRIQGGKIHTDDRDKDTADGFKLACDAAGVGFINLAEPFRKYYRDTGKFPRGFYNGFPAKGHLNEQGNRLAAEAIVEYLRKHRDDIFAD